MDPLKLVNLTEQAQASPCPYGLLGIFLDGRLLDYRPINSGKLVSLITRKDETHL